ncbi:hypothetical protein OS493_000492 [Desmophyllum pertusum]|uniref:Uncharacterized protein n=1 Tax=Desmophyllum pertusum TaxID=174260 RepID=A0A9X0A746_9CNID|nr:hypothetical protein OS493_000492 [Desmophyllum pertusum]
MKVPATVTQEAETPRSYIVNSPGGTIKRNRKGLTLLYPSSPDLSKQGLSSPDSSKQVPRGKRQSSWMFQQLPVQLIQPQRDLGEWSGLPHHLLPPVQCSLEVKLKEMYDFNKEKSNVFCVTTAV